ncbi:alpha/beta hydrolase [Terrabacter sp. 2YAF2]|uniref:alpha/beta hydrolase n=1 Tax=Terrabacter sp. 2YAF2 TaxID=3233026 RepID=UPI003F996F03
MGRSLRRIAATAVTAAAVGVCTVSLAACTTSPGQPSSQRTTATTTASVTTASRSLAGVPLVACTIRGERPTPAQASALCGTLSVPEDRSKPAGRQIPLRVAVIPASGTRAAADPVFAVAGGPGEASTQFFAWFPSVYTELHAAHDIVLVDQRGTGASKPESLPPLPATTGLSRAVADARLATWARDGLRSVDVDPRQLTSTVAADDLDAVRAALGYGKTDLYGSSYGATLVQYYLRQHPEHVRVAVLDGGTPLDVPVFERMAASSQVALGLLLRRCAEDLACHGAFPRLDAEWREVLARFRTPVRVVDRASGQSAVIDQAMLAEAIHAALLTEAGAAQLPLAIHLTYAGKYVEASALIGLTPSTEPSLLMADEILCSEAWARDASAEVARLGAGSYDLSNELRQAQSRAAMCAHLPSGVVPTKDADGVRTNLPVLWLAGDGDPQDPRSNLAGVAAQQPHSKIVVLPAQQHVVGHLGCLPSVVAAFVAAGSVDGLDTSCVAAGSPAPPFRLR